MDNFYKELKSKTCHCGGEIEVNIGYSCPIAYICKCKNCKNINYYNNPDEEGIHIMSFEESVRKRPHLYLEHENEGIRTLAREALEND